MIPKKIHYCWFGRNPLPNIAIKCIESWKKHLPDFEIIEWNEDNFDIDSFQYTKEAYENKKYAFVSDVCRLYALKEFGGLYMDTDLEVIKPLYKFLNHSAVSGFESNSQIPTALMGSIKKGKWVSDMLAYYDNKSFFLKDKSLDLKTNVDIITALMKPKGIKLNNTYQELDDYIVFYPSEFFCPKNYISEEINLTPNSHCIHHFSGSWYPWHRKFLKQSKKILINIFGYKNIDWFILFAKSLKIKFNKKRT